MNKNVKKEIVFYCFKAKNELGNQASKVIKCTSIPQANELFDTEYLNIKNGTSKYDYCDITINFKMYRNSKR